MNAKEIVTPLSFMTALFGQLLKLIFTFKCAKLDYIIYTI